jgi:transposase
MDRAGWHISERLVIPSEICVEYLPAYSPELQAAERLWSQGKRILSSTQNMLQLYPTNFLCSLL